MIRLFAALTKTIAALINVIAALMLLLATNPLTGLELNKGIGRSAFLFRAWNGPGLTDRFKRSNYLVRILIITITVLLTFLPLNDAQASTIVDDRVKLGPSTYALGNLNGQSPMVPEFIGAWYELGGMGNSGSDLQTISGGLSPLRVNGNNLIVLNISVDRRPGKADTLKIWLNPSSYSDLQAGINSNQVTKGDVLEGEDQLMAMSFDWGRSSTEGDELCIGTNLSDVLTPAS